jgi:hypothetical protein
VRRELEAFVVRVGVVPDSALADGRHVEEAVDEVASKVEAERALDDRVAVRAEAAERLARGEAEVADDGLVGRVGAAPVAGPAGLVAVAVGVVAAEENAGLVAVGDAVVPGQELGDARC